MVSSVGSLGPSAKRLEVSLNRVLAPYRQRDRCLMFPRVLLYELQHRARSAELSIPLTVRTALNNEPSGGALGLSVPRVAPPSATIRHLHDHRVRRQGDTL
jgi:hypothetical protein